ncbi:cyanophycin synthetase [Legionella quinlivanii]|uniref:Cyanophycin synthetase n=1 Tax=Legionella quinlivanii TaxID=45073 RepID=A0A0W0Y410_9GAMM|nr:Mur ligase family protein [Legionella quinlivanii]KTD51382.1 cyanophycin synthetase [Legionella quinlivanii]SEG12321.1 Mur ligase middle domain-containing protein [Legionella quinlivanii DSM 21216]STY10142.1 cyanophycin synthetase [Legionella quinlivanii]
MEILKLNALQGPNYWSTTHTRLIVLELDLLNYETRPSNSLQGFTDALERLFPSLAENPSSDSCEGGFLQRLRRGIPLSSVIEQVALELQSLAGMTCSFGRTQYIASRGVYQIIFSYELEEAGLYAAKTAVSIVECLALCKPYLCLENDLSYLKQIRLLASPAPGILSILKEAEKRNIPYYRLDNEPFYRLGQGCNQRLLCATLGSQNSSIGVDNAYDETAAKKILASQGIPVIQSSSVKGHNFIFLVINFKLAAVIKQNQPITDSKDDNEMTSMEVTAQTHTSFVFLAERVARLMHLHLCEVVIVSEDIRLPLNETSKAIFQVNAAPRIDQYPFVKHIAASVIDMLYPPHQSSRIPIVALTGVKGQPGLAQLIASMADKYDFSSGFTSVNGACIAGQPITLTNDKPFNQARAVLRDPAVNFAVFECDAESIYDFGLAFDHCDIGIVMNVAEESSAFARAKEAILRSVHSKGYCILNADNDLVYSMRTIPDCPVALFSLNADNLRINEHCQQNGLSAYLEDHFLIVRKGNKIKCRIYLPEITESCLAQNILTTVLVFACFEFNLDSIDQKLASILEREKSAPRLSDVVLE